MSQFPPKSIEEYGGSFLEIGPSVGVVAVQAALQGARVIAIDINPAAVANTRTNAQKHNVSVDAREGDLFDGLNPGEFFDVIYWNIPFLPYAPINRHRTIRSCNL